jgi:hypothetical protein
MKSKDVQEAIKSLQQFLMDEYGWDTQKSADDPSMDCVTISEITRKLEAEHLPSKLLKSQNTAI